MEFEICWDSSGEVILFPDTSKADFTQVSKLRMNYTERVKAFRS
nr:hypothetical protein [Mycoplasmopsis bovis]